ncbi:hypothetical protein O3P69_008425 [Scylla paramamosain]|uniref:Uncharacterized protein n=1 Tax=Scylla paramamosain TaxID=85552 RepID=A0AAW0SL40_SCYPA
MDFSELQRVPLLSLAAHMSDIQFHGFRTNRCTPSEMAWHEVCACSEDKPPRARIDVTQPAKDDRALVSKVKKYYLIINTTARPRLPRPRLPPVNMILLVGVNPEPLMRLCLGKSSAEDREVAGGWDASPSSTRFYHILAAASCTKAPCEIAE